MRRFSTAYRTRRGPTPASTDNFDETMRRVESEGAGGVHGADRYDLRQLESELRSGVHARKALVVISDGMDNHSRYTREELLRLAEESDAQIYTIATVSAVNPVQPPKPAATDGSKAGTPLSRRPRSQDWAGSASSSATGRKSPKRPPALAGRCGINTSSDTRLAAIAGRGRVAQDQGQSGGIGDEGVRAHGISRRSSRRILRGLSLCLDVWA